MTFAEFVVLIAVAVFLYKILGPLRARIEARVYRFLRKKMGTPNKPVIDITDYKKPKDP